MQAVSLSELSPLSQDARDIKVLEDWAYHRTLIEDHPVPCLMCGNRLSEAEIIESNSRFLALRVAQSSRGWWRTGLLSLLTGKFFRK